MGSWRSLYWEISSGLGSYPISESIGRFRERVQKGKKRYVRNLRLLSGKQRDGETLETFDSVLSGKAAMFYLGTLERRILRDVFVVIMSNNEAQTELCRSIKTQYEVYRIALSYERGDKYAKTYKVSDGGLAAAPARALQIKTEPISAICGGYCRPCQWDGREAGRTNNRGGADRKCFNCDHSGFKPDHIAKCRARISTCNLFRRKTGHYQCTCRGRRAAGWGRVSLIHRRRSSPTRAGRKRIDLWKFRRMGDYVVMSIKRKNAEELKVAGTKLALKTQTWIDSGSPISIFTIGKLKRTLGKQIVQLYPIDPKNDQFRDYRNNTLTLIGNLVANLLSNGWTIQAAINVIGLHTIHHRSGSDAGAVSDVGPGASGARSTQIRGQLEAAAKGEDLYDW